MINESVSYNRAPVVGFGECPIIRPDGIYYGGHKVIQLTGAVDGVGVGDVGDLLAYRQMWEPFIAAHLALWQDLNERLEGIPSASQCPPGLFAESQISPNLSSTMRAYCSALSLSRIHTSTTDPGGILPQWNAWKDKSSAEMVAGAGAMLDWHQKVVMRVGQEYAKDLLQITKTWNIPITLPVIPSFSLQQEIRARIEGAYITTKGVIQILGYSAGDLLGEARDLVDATAKGLTDSAKALPKALNWALIAGAVAVAVVGGALIVYYVPRRPSPPKPASA